MEGESSTEIGATYGAPQQQDTEARPTVACLRCRDQKLRCDRDVPSCMRCRKQRAVCKYPSPPNRRRIAQKTSEAKAAAAVAASQVNVVEHVQQPEVSIALSSRKKQRIVENDGKDEIRREHIPDPNLNHTSEDTATAELPSTEVGLLLLEIYFKRVYNATLLFHKTVAFQLYRQDGIPGYLLRAIFAHAATFLEQVDSPYEENIKIIPMPKLSEKSWSWARAASREALSYADEPTLVRIQALQVLELYYFSRGEIHRSIIHASLAYKLSQLLGYDRLHGSGALPSAYRNLQFDHEIKRRCFWASWCSILIGSQPLDSSRVCEKVMGLPLPARLGNGGLAQAIELKLGQRMGVDWTTSTESSPPSQSGLPPCSLMAELIKLLGIWTKVKAFICEPLNSSDPQRTVQLNKLTELLDREGRSLNLPLTKLQARAEVYEESPELLTSVTSVYYLSQMLLYASRVPMFSGRFAESADSRKSVQQNGEMTFQHATGFAELLKQFASEDLDITRLWPFVGYATFVAGSVFVSYRNTMQSAGSGCQSGQVPVPLSEELKTIKTTLGVLSIYWKPLRILSAKLNKAIETGQSGDLELLTAGIYPWDTFRSSHSSWNFDDTISVPNNSNPLLRTSPNVILADYQEVDWHMNNTESHRTGPELQNFSQARAGTERVLSEPPDSGYQSTVGDTLWISHGGNIFESDWWDVPFDGWEYPHPLGEMPSRNPVG